MRQNLLLFLLAAMLFFYSCTETIEIDTVPVNNILVVNSLITPDSLFWCYVSKVYAINDSTPHYVDDATVKIFDNESNELVCELILDSAGVYRAVNTTASADKTYRIEVYDFGYPIVSGVAQIPPKQEATDVSVIEDAGFEALLNDSYSELYFSIDDRYAASNYYEAIFSHFQCTNKDFKLVVGFDPGITLDDSIYNIEDACFFSHYTIVDAVINAEGLMKYNPSTLVFSDNLFNLQEHDFIIRSSMLSGNAYSMMLYTLSEDLYKFRTSLMQHLYERGAKGVNRFDDFAGLDFSSKAVDVYSNLSGGYGIFAGYNSQILYSKFDTVTYVDSWGEVHTSIRSHCDTLSDGRIRVLIDQTTNPYGK